MFCLALYCYAYFVIQCFAVHPGVASYGAFSAGGVSDLLGFRAVSGKRRHARAYATSPRLWCMRARRACVPAESTQKIPLQRVKQLRVRLAQARSRPPNPRQKVSCSCIRSGTKCTNGRVQKVGYALRVANLEEWYVNPLCIKPPATRQPFGTEDC